MKTTKLKYVLIYCIFIILYSCPKSKDVNNTVADINICTEPCAIHPNKPYNYDTETGKASYVIPFPNKSTLKEISNKGNIITYKCFGGDFKDTNLQTRQFNKSGLSKTPGAALTIIVEFIDFDCGTASFVKKKKKTIIKGSPIVLECGFIN